MTTLLRARQAIESPPKEDPRRSKMREEATVLATSCRAAKRKELQHLVSTWCSQLGPKPSRPSIRACARYAAAPSRQATTRQIEARIALLRGGSLAVIAYRAGALGQLTEPGLVPPIEVGRGQGAKSHRAEVSHFVARGG